MPVVRSGGGLSDGSHRRSARGAREVGRWPGYKGHGARRCGVA